MSLVPNQPVRFDPLKFRELQISLYQVHQTLFRTFLLFFCILLVEGGSGAETSYFLSQPRLDYFIPVLMVIDMPR